jgi:hypothetical protein
MCLRKKRPTLATMSASAWFTARLRHGAQVSGAGAEYQFIEA